jgi:hypothetical protein
MGVREFLDLWSHCPFERESFLARVSETQWGVFSGVFGWALSTVRRGLGDFTTGSSLGTHDKCDL